MHLYTLSRAEKLKSKKSIEKLFKTGRHFSASPLSIIYHLTENDTPLKIAVIVPKKKFKRAVDRNLLKRRIREAYRLNKLDFISFLTAKNMSMEIAFIYHSEQILESSVISNSLVSIFNRLKKSI